tara:strand:- start:912 stop:1220 length:309 start_codon:yes stop_codon:yes gene_type:complete
MPIYEYACDPCLVIFKTSHKINEKRPSICPKFSECKHLDEKIKLKKVISAPGIIGKKFSSPTAAKYSNMTISEELAKEKELQKIFQTLWMPEEVKHDPWEDH